MAQPFPAAQPRTARLRLSRPTPPALTPVGEYTPVRAQLERICASRVFAGANRSQLFLRYVVEHSLSYPDEGLKEYSIALDVFDRDAYDPAVNNTVRVEAARLRSRLLEYYASEGRADPLLIEVPRGAYRAVIRPRQPEVLPAEQPLASAATPRPRQPWAIAAAFILGALLGYRASH